MPAALKLCLQQFFYIVLSSMAFFLCSLVQDGHCLVHWTDVAEV